MKRIRACTADAIKEGELLAVDGAPVPLGLARSEGEWFAFEDNCTHEDFPLTEGDVEGTEIECALHGARFCLKSGEARAVPATCGIRVFPVTVEDGVVYVEMP